MEYQPGKALFYLPSKGVVGASVGSTDGYAGSAFVGASSHGSVGSALVGASIGDVSVGSVVVSSVGVVVVSSAG